MKPEISKIFAALVLCGMAAGAQAAGDVVIAVGLAAIEAYYIEGMHVDGGSHQVQVLSAKKDIEGNREVFNTAQKVAAD